jgi:hypothetical protein
VEPSAADGGHATGVNTFEQKEHDSSLFPSHHVSNPLFRDSIATVAFQELDSILENPGIIYSGHNFMIM